jgi:hypothetical protein
MTRLLYCVPRFLPNPQPTWLAGGMLRWNQRALPVTR